MPICSLWRPLAVRPLTATVPWWSWSGNLALSTDTASCAAVLGGLGPRVDDPHTLTPANKGIAKTPPGTSVIDVEVRPR